MDGNEKCWQHEDRSAVGYCAFCGRPVCDECHDGAYCNFCISTPPKRKSVALLLAVLLGWLGGHRYYMGFYFTGIIYTITLGFFGIGWAIDIIRILLWSTVTESTHSLLEDFAGAVGDVISQNMSSDTRSIWKHRFWRDKYGRPLLPISGKQSLT
jgi:TM2 domain-containing membrane protein YozV